MTGKAVLCALALLPGFAAPALARDHDHFVMMPPAAPEQNEAARTAEILIAQAIAVERARFAPDAPVLAEDAALTRIARSRSDDMAQGAPFSHQDSSGAYPARGEVREVFGPYGAIGENIMKQTGLRRFDPAAFARIAVASWMASPGHRENILLARFSKSGIGVTVRGGAVFATQVFFGPPRPQ